jgi:hypothetical protein
MALLRPMANKLKQARKSREKEFKKKTTTVVRKKELKVEISEIDKVLAAMKGPLGNHNIC